MPYVRHVYILPPLVMPYIKHAYLGLYIGVSLKGRITCIWSFDCGFAYAATMGCTGFKLLFGIIICL